MPPNTFVTDFIYRQPIGSPDQPQEKPTSIDQRGHQVKLGHPHHQAQGQGPHWTVKSEEVLETLNRYVVFFTI